MRVTQEIRYEAAPQEVAAMLADPAFVDRKCTATGALRHDAQVTGGPTGAFTVTTVRTMSTDRVPDVARRFVGETLEVRQVEDWGSPVADGSRTGTVLVEIVGAPLRLTGTLRLEPAPGGTVERVEGDLKASVPLVGGTLERAAEPAIVAGLRTEQRVGTAWLADRRT